LWAALSVKTVQKLVFEKKFQAPNFLPTFRCRNLLFWRTFQKGQNSLQLGTNYLSQNRSRVLENIFRRLLYLQISKYLQTKKRLRKNVKQIFQSKLRRWQIFFFFILTWVELRGSLIERICLFFPLKSLISSSIESVKSAIMFFLQKLSQPKWSSFPFINCENIGSFSINYDLLGGVTSSTFLLLFSQNNVTKAKMCFL